MLGGIAARDARQSPMMQFVKRAQSDHAIGPMARAKLHTPFFAHAVPTSVPACGRTWSIATMLSRKAAAIEHTDVSTGLSYAELVKAFEHELGRWNPATAENLVQRKAGWEEVEAEAASAGGARGLMIIHSIDQGAVTSLSGRAKDCRLYLVGNPVIATRILDIDPRGAFYVPFRVCLYSDGGAGGAGIYYDRPSSFLAALGHAGLAEIGSQLDAKIDDVVATITAGR
jgi:uncharacterized protein (DUF302 family)